MHMVIRTIVYAKDRIGALEEAESDFIILTGENAPFDYYTMFNQDGNGVSGADRWGLLSPVSKATSKNGKKLIDDGMRYTRKGLLDDLKVVREELNTKTDDEIVGSRWGESKYRFNCLGQYRGPSIYLYHEGEGVTCKEHLEDVLSKWKCLYEDKGLENPHKGLGVWVVPADVHY